MAYFLIFKGDDIFKENAIIAKQSPMCVHLKNSFTWPQKLEKLSIIREEDHSSSNAFFSF